MWQKGRPSESRHGSSALGSSRHHCSSLRSCSWPAARARPSPGTIDGSKWSARQKINRGRPEWPLRRAACCAKYEGNHRRLRISLLTRFMNDPGRTGPRPNTPACLPALHKRYARKNPTQISARQPYKSAIHNMLRSTLCRTAFWLEEDSCTANIPASLSLAAIRARTVVYPIKKYVKN